MRLIPTAFPFFRSCMAMARRFFPASLEKTKPSSSRVKTFCGASEVFTRMTNVGLTPAPAGGSMRRTTFPP
jgi:hypothetical protein